VTEAEEQPPTRQEQIFSLHRYFVSANWMRTCFDKWLDEQGKPEVPVGEPFIFMGYWYAGLYVVIEGWQELKLTDKVIDTLLASPNVGLLKRYRHGVCHFQGRYFDDRFMGFMSTELTAVWVRKLNQEFGRWFLAWLAENKRAGERQS